MSKVTVTIHKEVHGPVTRFNPFISDMPVAGPQIYVLKALEYAFMQCGFMFAGSVAEFIKFGVLYGLEERKVKQGFEDLVRYGYLQIEGDVFTPTDKFIKRALKN